MQNRCDWKVILLDNSTGDGLVHEVVQGILQLEKQKRPSQVRLIVIPCGTGNALSVSMGVESASEALEKYFKQGPIPLKISAVYAKHQDSELIELLKYSFCVVSWGFHAQVVRQSEGLRKLGNIRFLVNLIEKTWKYSFSCKFLYMTNQ